MRSRAFISRFLGLDPSYSPPEQQAEKLTNGMIQSPRITIAIVCSPSIRTIRAETGRKHFSGKNPSFRILAFVAITILVDRGGSTDLEASHLTFGVRSASDLTV
jgi:hypothetical protein